MSLEIMIVDDEKDITFTVKSGLENFDDQMKVIEINDGFECLKLLSEGKIPDLILIDIMMPRMNGWELVNRIKENNEWKQIPLIFLTAKTDDFSKTFGKTITQDFIEKPFDIKELHERILRVFRKINESLPHLE